MNEDFTDILSAFTSRTVTVRAADGRTMVQTRAVNVAAAGAAAIIFAPRLAAAAAVGALLAGVTMSVDTPAVEVAEGAAG